MGTFDATGHRLGPSPGAAQSQRPDLQAQLTPEQTAQLVKMIKRMAGVLIMRAGGVVSFDIGELASTDGYHIQWNSEGGRLQAWLIENLE